MKIVLATQNPVEVAALQEALRDLGITIIPEINKGAGEAAEVGVTLSEKASNKAQRAVRGLGHPWAMAVAFAPTTGGSLDTLIEKLKFEQPQARWRTYGVAIAVINPDGHEWSFTGQMRGTLVDDSIGLRYHGQLFDEVRKHLAEFCR